MTPDEARKLAGGYATGSLTDAERKALFEAALEDQGLFDELGDEVALKEVLDDPGARQRLLAALEPPRHRAWLWGWAGATATLAILTGVVVSQRTPPPPEQIAQVQSAPEPVVTPAAPPPKATLRKVAPAPAPPAEVRQEKLADQIQEAKPQAAAGAVREFAAGPPAAGARRAQNETVTVTRELKIYFSYAVRADGSLQITILEPGFLSVTASLAKSEVDIFPSAAVAPPRIIRLQIPSDAIGLVIGFSKTPGLNDAPILQVAATGIGFIDPKASYRKIRIQPTPLFLKLETR